MALLLLYRRVLVEMELFQALKIVTMVINRTEMDVRLFVCLRLAEMGKLIFWKNVMMEP